MLVALILHKNICKYHLDKETDLYYLNSRYYDPEIGRFLSADRPDYLEPESINGLNLYRYCANNPVMMNDTEGNAPAWWEWVVSGILIVVGTVLCATLAGSAFGAGLIAAGRSMMASNIMSAIGVDGKVASIISAGLNIVAGVALCFTPLAAFGASMIGSGVGSIGGGFLSEALGFGFQAGAIIGGIVGGIVGGQVYKGIAAIKLSAATSKITNISSQVTKDSIVIRGVKNSELTKEARNIRAGLAKTVDGQTISNASAGRAIHKGFMTGKQLSVRGGGSHGGIGRLDGFANNTIFELKPNNIRAIKQGIGQLLRYNNALGGGYNMVLVLY